MKKAKKLLILTDHAKHTTNNSFYAIATALKRLDYWEAIHICSRGLESNQKFFEGRSSELWVNPLDRAITFSNMRDRWKENVTLQKLGAYDSLLLRLPRPVGRNFFAILEQNFREGQIINRPSGIMLTGHKKYLLNFPEIAPQMRWVNSPEEAIELSKKFGIVLKPGEEYGGKGILKIQGNHLWAGDEKMDLSRLSEFFLPEGMLAMKFLTNVTKGDKRTIVAGDKILGSTIRFPPPDSWMCNIAQGGYAEQSMPDEEDEKIVQVIGPKLKEHGIVLYGFDTLVNDDGHRVLSEINSLSIGGIAPLEKTSGRPLSQEIATIITHYFRTNYEDTHSGPRNHP